MRALWSVFLMLVLNLSLLNGAYTLINVLKALVTYVLEARGSHEMGEPVAFET
jgi:hypothetical protein